MADNYKKLTSILRQMFQLDQADLDFGIYRIMNQKRDEVNDFLENRLITQVKEILQETDSGESERLKEELDNLVNTLRDAGVDPETNEKVLEKRKAIAQSDSLETLENEVFSHLTNFFRRYYDKGDFVSQRRYKDGVYVIPYEGEEVKLHWANHDQYYIKTTEYLNFYRFKVRDGKAVSFELLDASQEQDNKKAPQGKERRFYLAPEEFYRVEGNELKVFFYYELVDKKNKQAVLLQEAFETLKENLPNEWLQVLLEPKPTEKNKYRTLLEKKLNEYTARNTFDYFIHKDLEGFLKRELDFYVKNEVLHLDDIDWDNQEDFQKHLQIVKAIKQVAHKIIDFLAQLENFQKKLWLKKKFVVQSDYCITLDRIPEAFYEEIAANDTQREEWVKLFAIDEIQQDMYSPGYSKPLTVDFLKANPYLQVDTQFFSKSFKYKLLAEMDNLDEQTDGLLINSENFQALNLINRRYENGVDCIYIDPPYNSPSSEIIYKNSFKHSSWLSLLENRMSKSKHLSSRQGSVIIAIDENEQENLGKLIDFIYPDYNKTCISVIHNKKGIQGSYFSFNNEYAYFIIPNELKNINNKVIPKEEWKYSNFRNWGNESLRSDAKNCFYPIYVKDDKIIGYGEVPPDDYHPKKANDIGENGVITIYPIDNAGNERKWRYAYQSIDKTINSLKVETSNGIKQILKAQTEAKFKTVWTDSKYIAGDYGTKVLTNLGFTNGDFDFPKSIYLVEDSIYAVANKSAIVLDFFAGSATTAHSVINLNQKDNGQRKYIMVEMAEYFNKVTKPRVQKAAYSQEWKDGKPINRKGISHSFKYMKLEGYEDTLNNLRLKRTDQQTSLLDDPRFGEEYMLHYMLDVESRESLLNTEMFRKPFGYTIFTTENNEFKETEVDLVETFNYLIGLQVEQIQLIRDFVVVMGKNLQEESILVIWRDMDKRDNQALNEFFRKQQFNPRDQEFDRIYVNGDNNLENLKTAEDRWKVILIEEEFRKRMFEDVE